MNALSIKTAWLSNFFDMGTNVPAIFQVPDAVNHLPPGLIALNHLAAAGLTLIMLAFLAFVSTLVLHAIAAYVPDGAGEED